MRLLYTSDYIVPCCLATSTIHWPKSREQCPAAVSADGVRWRALGTWGNIWEISWQNDLLSPTLHTLFLNKTYRPRRTTQIIERALADNGFVGKTCLRPPPCTVAKFVEYPNVITTTKALFATWFVFSNHNFILCYTVGCCCLKHHALCSLVDILSRSQWIGTRITPPPNPPQNQTYLILCRSRVLFSVFLCDTFKSRHVVLVIFMSQLSKFPLTFT